VRHFVSGFRIRLRVARRFYSPNFSQGWFKNFPMALHFGAEQGGFGDFVVDVLSATKSPASALPAHRAPDFFMQGFALGFITATLRFESPSSL